MVKPNIIQKGLLIGVSVFLVFSILIFLYGYFTLSDLLVNGGGLLIILSLLGFLLFLYLENKAKRLMANPLLEYVQDYEMAIDNAAINNKLFHKKTGIIYLLVFIGLLLITLFLIFIFFSHARRPFGSVGELEVALIAFFVLPLIMVAVAYYSSRFKAKEGMVSITPKSIFVNGRFVFFSSLEKSLEKVRYIPGTDEKPGVMKFTYKDKQNTKHGGGGITYTNEIHIFVPSQYNQKAKEAANAIIREYSCYSL